MLGGWLTTKKRGQDDGQIEKDRIKALQLRKATKKGSTARPKAPPKKKASRSRRDSDEESADEDEDDDSINDFVVEDDDDEISEDEISSSEDELIAAAKKGAKSKPVASKRKRKVQSTSDEESSQDEEDESFLQTSKKRTSKAPSALRAGGAKKKPKARGTAASTAKPKGKRLQKKKNAGVVDLLSTDDDDIVVLDEQKKKTPVKVKQTKTSSNLQMDGFSSDDELPSASKLGVKSAAPEQTQTSRFFGAAASTTQGTSTRIRIDTSSNPNPKKTPPKSNRPVARKEDSDDDDTPILPTAIRKRNGNNKRRAIQEDSDDDDDVVVTKPVTKPSARNSSTAQDDFASDEEEAVALAWAMGESQKAAAKKEHSITDSPEQQEEEEDAVNLLEESSEDEGDGDEEDAYVVDKDAKAAGSVLATANELSAQVLKTMTSWAAARKGSSETDDGDAVPLGMIVDGALALSSMDVDEAASNDHSWISQELMRKICPNVTLANYQLIGVNWMALLHGMKCEVKGKKSHTNVNGILADEMGLGKTVQTIAFLAWLKHTNQKGEPEAGNSLDKAVMLDDDEDDDDDSVAVVNSSDNGDGPHLVIAPASVLSNWAREFENFAPHLNVLKYHGSQAERREQQAELRPHLAGREASRRNSGIEPIDVILAPITYFQKEKSDDRSFLRKFHFDYLVVDEAHVLKNASGTRYKSLDRFSTKHRLLLTGTPVQNSPKELMSLLCFLMPLFSRKSATFDDNDQNDGGASMLQHFVKNEGGKNGYSDKTVFKKLKQLFAPFVLRRSKDDVLSQILPPKERKVEFVELDSAGRNTYDSILAKHIKEKKNGTTSREHLFTQLRKAANHPLMLRTRYKLPAEKEHLAHTFYRYGAFSGEGCTKLKVAEELELFNDFQIHLTALELISENGARRADCGRYVLEEEDLFSSAKFVRLRKLLPELIAGGHRILIFSVWTSCLDLLSCLLEQMTFDYLRMDGSTPVTDRQNLIDKFNGDTTIPIFLLSTKACGLGINLTAADTCIMHDLDFNPFNDLQAEDRCHRIGQKKPVTVFKLVSKDTVDEDIYGMQQRKAMMNAAIMDNGSTAKEGTKEKDAVMRAAVDRFLKSPKAKSPQTLADEKENETKNESAII